MTVLLIVAVVSALWNLALTVFLVWFVSQVHDLELMVGHEADRFREHEVAHRYHDEADRYSSH